MNDDLRDRVEDVLRGYDARYIETYLDETDTTRVRYCGLELEKVARNTGIGGCVRVLAQGWGFANFNNSSDLLRKVVGAVHHAGVVGGEPVDLAPVKLLVDSVPLLLKDVLDQCNHIMWETYGITITMVGDSDQYTRRIVASSDGAYIQQEKVDVALRVSATARNGVGCSAVQH
jgi:predicted Zn-dependent protease